MLNFTYLVVLTLLSFLLSSCSGSGGGDSGSPSVSENPEPSNCIDLVWHADPITLSGTASYEYRAPAVVSGSPSYVALSGNPISAGIPFAEVEVLNSDGQRLQCGNTDATGAFSVTVPRNYGSVKIKINSRSFNSKLKVSVLEETQLNSPYSLEISTTAGATNISGLATSATARASVSSKIEGGAFHILASIYKANEYIRTQISNPNWSADKVTVYWKAGFNPYAYFGQPDNPLSFYRPGEKKLYILGGSNGNVNQADTDHFDTSVILHEYAHFLEDVYGKTDSPGGYHNGNSVIDPRLAWSEGFANFFQAAAQGTSYYLDTSGFCNDSVETGQCSQNVFFRLDESGTTTAYDRPSTGAYDVGEGSFREISITRTLFKIISPTSQTFGVGIPFSELWTIFTDSSAGFAALGKYFRSMHLMMYRLNQVVSASYSSSSTKWSTLLSNENQSVNFKEYNSDLSQVNLNTCAYRDLTPALDATYCSGSTCPIYKESNQLRSNDFFRYEVTQSDIDAGATLQVSYFQCPVSVTNPSGPSDSNCTTSSSVDLDLYLYKNGYSYADEYLEKEKGEQSSDIVKKSARVYGALETGLESINLSQLTPGIYLINVKASTYGKNNSNIGVNAKYRVQKISGATQRDLCPTNL